MVEDYKSIKNSKKVWEKYRVSHTTVLKWSKLCNLENKSSAPNKPTKNII